ncbi:MAG: acyltransferase [Ignavibacteria bacterium]|nr:acyltransferase [Ignavibacteria bacterium]
MKKLEYFIQLDSLRGIAIILVLFGHFFTVNEVNLYADNRFLGIVLMKLSLFGLRGVELFFILSGYLITRILLNSKNSPNYFTSFFMRRLLRIFPLYYFILFLSFIIYPLFTAVPPEANDIINTQWKLWTYLSNVYFYQHISWDIAQFPNFGHFWTLSVEEHFYLLWPLLIYFVPIKNLGMKMWLIFAFSLLFWIIGNNILFFQWTTLTYSGTLALGGLIAYYESIYPDKIKKIALYTTKKYYFLVVIFLIIVFFPRNIGFYKDFFTHILSMLLFASLLLIVLYNNIRFFHSNSLIFIGKISYGIYIYHALLRPFYKDIIYTKLITAFYTEHAIAITMIYTIVSAIISITIAWISWELFEKQVLKLKKYYPYA